MVIFMMPTNLACAVEGCKCVRGQSLRAAGKCMGDVEVRVNAEGLGEIRPQAREHRVG